MMSDCLSYVKLVKIGGVAVRALEIDNLSKRYAGGLQALNDVSFSVEAGEFFGMLGPNGAGKTTTLNIITSLVHKTSGSVKVFGTSIDDDFASVKRRIGVVPQEFNFMIFETVASIVTTSAGYYGVPRKVALERSEQLMHQLGLWDKRNVQSRRLSGGMKRRLMIVRALMHDPDLLILDEPTAGVDIELRRSMWEFLREMNSAGKTIILTSHYLEEIEQLCKRIAVIDKGKILDLTTTHDLIAKLPEEAFIFDVADDLPEDFRCDKHAIRKTSATTLETSIAKGEDLNAIFAWLSANGIKIVSMRNSANRLEESFVQILAGK
jgi:ABC-2 type transport system ATP-binding protein